MYAPSKLGEQPSIEVSKEFMLKPNKIHLEASLDKEVTTNRQRDNVFHELRLIDAYLFLSPTHSSTITAKA